MSEITLRPSIKQHLAYQALNNPKIDTVFLGGGAGGGKSWLICESRLINAIRFPGYKSFIGREELKRLMQSTYLTWVKVCQYHNVPQEHWNLNGQYNYIQFVNGSRIDLIDLKMIPSDPLFERLGSTEYTDGAIEEAGEVDFLAYDVLKSRVGRHMNKELGLHPSILITGNPKKNWTYQEFYKPWKNGTLPESTAFIQSLYTDNPFTAQEYGRQLSGIKDKATKERLMYGNWEYADDDNALMPYDSITDLYTNIVPSGDKYLSADIARMGRDSTVIRLWQGLKCYKTLVWSQQTTDVTADKIKELLQTEGIARSHVVIDEDGVGGGVVDALKGVKGFINNSTALEHNGERENFQNLKTQCYYKLADYVNERKIRIEDHPFKEKEIEELEQVKRKDADKDGKLKLIPKEEIKELLGRSPDFSDSLMMRMWFELRAPKETGVHQFYPNLSRNQVKVNHQPVDTLFEKGSIHFMQ